MKAGEMARMAMHGALAETAKVASEEGLKSPRHRLTA